jgi:hypothetical protein
MVDNSQKIAMLDLLRYVSEVKAAYLTEVRCRYFELLAQLAIHQKQKHCRQIAR